MQKNKDYFVKWIEKLSLKIYLTKDSQKNYSWFFQKNNDEKIELFKSNFNFWVKYNYECSLILSICSLIEFGTQNDDLSFRKFLREFSEYYTNNKQILINEHIRNKPNYISISDLSTNYDIDIIEKERINQIKKFFKSINIENDKKILKENYEKIKKLRNKLYAHYTDYQENIEITHSDLEKILDDIINMLEKYSYLLNCSLYAI